MAQWIGQFSGNTHLSKIEYIEAQLRHAVDVYQSKTTLEDRRSYSKNITRFADRLLAARVRAAKAHLASLDPRDERGREMTGAKIVTLLEQGTSAILKEFGVTDVIPNAS